MSNNFSIPDDPIISCKERTGYPPWMRSHEPDEDDDDDYVGIGYYPGDNAWEEEDPDEHDDYSRNYELMAVYRGECYDDF